MLRRPVWTATRNPPRTAWSVSASNWLRAHEDGAAAHVALASIHGRALDVVQEQAVDVPRAPSPLGPRSVSTIVPPAPVNLGSIGSGAPVEGSSIPLRLYAPTPTHSARGGGRASMCS